MSCTQLKDQTCSISRLSPGVSLSLCLILHSSSSKHPSSPLYPPLPPSLRPVVAFPCYGTCCDCISHCAGPHSEGFHFRAEPGSHRRYWNLLPKQHWGWTLLPRWLLLMRVCLSQPSVCVRRCKLTFIFNAFRGPYRIGSDGDDTSVQHVCCCLDTNISRCTCSSPAASLPHSLLFVWRRQLFPALHSDTSMCPVQFAP